MEFSIIAPTSVLKQYAVLNRVNFVLANVYHRDGPYKRFYKEKAEEGVFTILDNGAYEGELLDDQALLDAMCSLKPNVLVLPDLLMGDWLENCSRALRFLDHFLDWHQPDKHIPEFMFVPQVSKETSAPIARHAWLQSVEKVALDPRVGYLVKWIGFGRYLHTEFINMHMGKYRRVQLAEALRGGYGSPTGHLKFHALGMGAGDPEELDALRECKLFESCDSSAPVWRGWNGVCLDQQGALQWEIKGTPCNFNAKFFPAFDEAIGKVDPVDAIRTNLERVGVRSTP